ncbi:hypothetical protein [Gordonia sp. UCD-TK1]|uniref:hypothetical protein n=1 Tax=Gordonia sp. UCD-TK1 TaxID=1857893 RepID=UPI0020C7B940|nr:hypothetical protein [Gordonia sp. UCD-TK1]
MVSNLIMRCDIPEKLRPLTMSRLRQTWALEALASVPLPAVMTAYGSRSLHFTDVLLPRLVDLAGQVDATADARLYEF